MTSTVVPTTKLMKVALSALEATTRTCPFTACCHPMPRPAISGRISIQSGTLVVSSAETDQVTATSARAAPVTRAAVSGRRPPGPSPMRSSASPLTVCPATIATVKSATPSTAAVSPCESTRKAPALPPSTYHQGSVRDCRADRTRPSPRRPAGAMASATRRISKAGTERDRRCDEAVAESLAQFAVDAGLHRDSRTAEQREHDREPHGHRRCGEASVRRAPLQPMTARADRLPNAS